VPKPHHAGRENGDAKFKAHSLSFSPPSLPLSPSLEGEKGRARERESTTERE